MPTKYTYTNDKRKVKKTIFKYQTQTQAIA